MPKNILQDMVMEKRRRRGIVETEQISRKEQVKEVRESIEEKQVLRKVEPKREDEGEYYTEKRKKGRSNKKLWVLAGVAVIFLFFSLSYLFSSANISITPKIKDVTLNENLSAIKEGSGDSLPFHLVSISGEEIQQVEATEQKEMSKAARGTVVIYNAFNTAPQKLDIDTRLEGSNGKIYKTEKAVTVPGMKGTIPGSVEVFVYGAEPGIAYNSEPLDFKIFGFKGTPKYAKFYARSKEPLTGGLTGKFPFIPDAQKTSLVADMKTALETKLFKKANDQIPSGFILFKNGAVISVDNAVVDLASATENKVPVKLTGTFYGLLFDENKLTKKIAQDTVKGYDGGDVYVQNIKELKFSLLGSDSTSIKDLKSINFTLTGTTKIVWRFDSEKLMSDLLGKPKSEFNKALLQYPNVDLAKSVISPFWRMSFPLKQKDIHITVNYPK